MIKFDNIVVPRPEVFEAMVAGARNAFGSWANSDSKIEYACFIFGENDLALLRKLCKAGSDHRKFMRIATVIVDITAPMFWWKEFDTYKVGTVRLSTSTMHCIHKRAFTLDDFTTDSLINTGINEDPLEYRNGIAMLENLIASLNYWRAMYVSAKDKGDLERMQFCWRNMIELLGSNYNQKAKVMISYETLMNIYHARRGHRLDEWKVDFMKFVSELPYFLELIGEKNL